MSTYTIKWSEIIPKTRLNTSTIYSTFFTLVVVVCFHTTNIAFGGIKIPELLMLGLMLFIPLFVNSIHKFTLLFFGFFLLLLIATFVKNPLQDFYLSGADISFLKEPFFITISRFIEYICCIVFVVYVYKSLLHWEEKGIPANAVLKKILIINAWLSIFFIAVFFCIKFGLLSPRFLKLYYNSDLRLRGFFDEGGPFGLMYAFLFGLTGFIPGKNRLLKLIFLVTIFLTQSKAGILMVCSWIFYNWFTGLPNKYFIKPFVLAAVSAVFITIGYYVSKNYIDDILNIQQEIMMRPNDSNLVMGRISGIFIAPKMIYHNPVLGIGLGNYSLVRNDPAYRGIFPPVDDWDLSGLGGIVTLTAENGLLGLSLLTALLLWFFYDLKKVHPKADRLVLLFLLPCIFGVQLYFLYVWFAIGLGVFYLVKAEKTTPGLVTAFHEQKKQMNQMQSQRR